MRPSLDSVTERHLEKVVDALVAEFTGVATRDVITGYVRRALADFHDAQVVDFVPVLVYRACRERLATRAEPTATADYAEALRSKVEALDAMIEHAARESPRAEPTLEALRRIREDAQRTLDELHVRSSS